MNNDNVQHNVNGELSKELKLLLIILAKEEGNELAYEYEELVQAADWPHFIELARHHRIIPTINRKLQQLHCPHIPAFVKGLFHKEYYRNTLQMLALSGEMERLSSLFEDNDIRTLFLKGPVIAADLYGDVSLRTSCDLDLIVPLDKLQHAEALLHSLGYIKDDYIETILNDWKWRHHHVAYCHPKKQIKVEVHWRLNPSPSKEPDFEELWHRKRRSSLITRPVYYLGREDLFLYLVAHGARHGWSRLRWLYDIKQLMNQSVDWPRLMQLLKRHQYIHIGGQALLLTARLLAVPLREEMRPLLSSRKAEWLAEDTMFYMRNMVNLHSPPLAQEVELYHKKYLYAILSKRQKLVFIFSLLYPYPKDAKTLPLPKQLHFLYFPLRPLLWMWRKARKQSA